MQYEKGRVLFYYRVSEMSMDELKKEIFGKYASSPDPIYKYEYWGLVCLEIKSCLRCFPISTIFRKIKIFLFFTSIVHVRENQFVTFHYFVGPQ